MIARSRFHRSSSPTRCGEVKRVMSAFIDGELDEDFAARVAEHLEDCRRCGLDADVYTQIKKSLQAKPPMIDDEAVERLRQFGSGLSRG